MFQCPFFHSMRKWDKNPGCSSPFLPSLFRMQSTVKEPIYRVGLSDKLSGLVETQIALCTSKLQQNEAINRNRWTASGIHVRRWVSMEFSRAWIHWWRHHRTPKLHANDGCKFMTSQEHTQTSYSRFAKTVNRGLLKIEVYRNCK